MLSESFPISFGNRYLKHLNNFSEIPSPLPRGHLANLFVHIFDPPVPTCLIAYSSRGMVVEGKVDIIRDD